MLKRLFVVVFIICSVCANCADFRSTLENVYNKSKSIGAIEGKNNWYFLSSELRFASRGTFWGAASRNTSIANDSVSDPLPAIIDFKNQLKKKGIELVLVPVPAKISIYPEMLTDFKVLTGQRLDKESKSFYDVLKKNNVTVLDLTPSFVKSKGSKNLYCKTDSHWSGAGIDAAAGLVSNIIKNKPWYKSVKKTKFTLKSKSIEINGDLAKMLKSNSKEKVNINVVGGNTIGKSPVLVLGDSHNLIFSAGGDMFAENAGFPDALAQKLSLPVELIAVKGSGATPARVSLMRKSDLLSNKKIVIWCFSAREFTESSQGWAKVPIFK